MGKTKQDPPFEDSLTIKAIPAPVDKLSVLRQAERERETVLVELQNRHAAAIDHYATDPDDLQAEQGVADLMQQIAEARERLAIVVAAIEKVESQVAVARQAQARVDSMQYRIEALRILHDEMPQLAAAFDKHIVAAREALVAFKAAADRCHSNTAQALSQGREGVQRADLLTVLGPRAGGTSDTVAVALGNMCKELLRTIDAPTQDTHVALNMWLPVKPATLAAAVALDAEVLRPHLS